MARPCANAAIPPGEIETGACSHSCPGTSSLRPYNVETSELISPITSLRSEALPSSALHARASGGAVSIFSQIWLTFVASKLREVFDFEKDDHESPAGFLLCRFAQRGRGKEVAC
jgi:hypothetical protein